MLWEFFWSGRTYQHKSVSAVSLNLILKKKLCSLQESSAYVTERRYATVHEDIPYLKLRSLNSEGELRVKGLCRNLSLTVSRASLVDGSGPSTPLELIQDSLQTLIFCSTGGVFKMFGFYQPQVSQCQETITYQVPDPFSVCRLQSRTPASPERAGLSRGCSPSCCKGGWHRAPAEMCPGAGGVSKGSPRCTNPCQAPATALPFSLPDTQQALLHTAYCVFILFSTENKK